MTSAWPFGRAALGWRLLLLTALLGLVVVGAASSGAVQIPLDRLPDLWRAAGDDAELQMWQGVFFDIRLPRILLGVITGAGLAVAGAVMQALFRNPLAEPGLVGISSGAAVGAVGAIILGLDRVHGLTVAGAAFGGSLLATLAAWRLGRRSPGAASILLAGIAVNAFCGALIGVFTYLADDAQLRGLTFWSLGSLAGGEWSVLVWLAPWSLLLILCLMARWRVLNALLLGEREALHLGFDLNRLRRELILLVALLVGPLVAFTGTIGFVGLVVPHLMRLLVGAEHRALMPLSMVSGALILCAADWGARIVVVPAELPIGIVTALLGAPFLLALIHREGC
ncbi:MAG: iron ABC transporter permease [Lautropia sp.]|nr:iron ABC transporter permease [Lautropia sp.]